MLAGALMTKTPLTVLDETKLLDAAALMLARHIRGVPVVDSSGALVGILTEGDVLRRAELGTAARPGRLETFLHPSETISDYIHAHGRIVSEVMTRDPVCVTPVTALAEVAAVMQREDFGMLPVVQDKKLVGVISRADLLGALARQLAATESGTASDAAIHSALMRALADERWAPQTGITVQVKNGVVDFSGTIFSEDERTALKIIAENIFGVTRVRDHFTLWYAQE